MQLISYILILLATVEFNKQLIDNVKVDPKEQREWHLAQMAQWIIIYTSLAYVSGQWVYLIGYGLTYSLLYDTLLNLRRGLKWNYQGKHDLPKLVKYALFIAGIGVLIWKIT